MSDILDDFIIDGTLGDADTPIGNNRVLTTANNGKFKLSPEPSIGSQLIYKSTGWTPESILNGFTIFPIWAEESGGLTNGNAQYSFGNGSTGNIGIPIPFDCELFAVGINADNVGTSVSINFRKFTTTVHTELFDSFTNESAFANITAVPFSAGDVLTFQTNTETGAFSDVRVVGWFRVKATAAFPTVDRKVVSNAGVGFTSELFADIPNMTTTVLLSDTGTVDGTVNYSALRSAAANAVTQFRVVINGNNGQSFFDTLSTFNDNGSAAHFVENLPAGSYTVTAQALTNNPITITSISLTASAVEN